MKLTSDKKTKRHKHRHSPYGNESTAEPLANDSSAKNKKKSENEGKGHRDASHEKIVNSKKQTKDGLSLFSKEGREGKTKKKKKNKEKRKEKGREKDG